MAGNTSCGPGKIPFQYKVSQQGIRISTQIQILDFGRLKKHFGNAFEMRVFVVQLLKKLNSLSVLSRLPEFQTFLENLFESRFCDGCDSIDLRQQSTTTESDQETPRAVF